MLRDDFVKLISPEGQALLGELVVDSKLDVLKTVTKLRAAGHDAGLVAVALSQAKLRARAVS